jgi:putative ABC transport system permease protein
MLFNYLKVIWRNLRRNPLYAGVSVAGLSLGLFCLLLAYVYIRHELSYDHFSPADDRTYRLAVERIYPDHVVGLAAVPSSYARVIRQEVPGVESTVRLQPLPEGLTIKLGGTTFKEERVLFADSTFFRFFSLPLVAGHPDQALRNPFSVVLTEETARKYFGNRPALGQTLVTPEGSFLVTGICKAPPAQAHFQFNLVASWNSLPFLVIEPNFLFFNAHTYLRLSPGTPADRVMAALPALVDKYAAGHVERHFGIPYADYRRAGNGYRYFLQPLRSIHLHSHLESELGANGSSTYVYLLGLSAGLLLLIAGLNFVNLATARTLERAREVGVRKVLGAGPAQLRGQFLGEAAAICLASWLLALVAAKLFAPLLAGWSGEPIDLPWAQMPGYAAAGTVVALGVGTLAGLYPAVVMASFPPVQVLKGRQGGLDRGWRVRNYLVAAQFFVSVGLLTGMLVIFRQVRFMREENLGFDKERVLVVEGTDVLTDSLADRRAVLRGQLLALPGVRSAGYCNPPPGQPTLGYQFRSEGGREVISSRGMAMDEWTVEALGLAVKEGRAFSEDFSDRYSVLLNEAAVREFNLARPVGTRLRMIHFNDSTRNEWYTVVGVLKNFHFQSMHQPVSPLVVLHGSNPNASTPFLSVRLAPGDPGRTLDRIRAAWQTVAPGAPYSGYFLDQAWDRLYRREAQWGQLFTFFAAVTLLLAAAGLLGLSAFLAGRRQKEISLRKLYGASLPALFLLLGGGFLRLVLGAAVAAVAVTGYGLRRWLDTFPYRIALDWRVWLPPLGVALLVGLLTISYYLLRSIRQNPARVLKEE